MKKQLYILLIMLTTWINIQAQSFTSQVSKNKVAVGEVFQVAFTVENAAGNVTLPNFKDFDVAGGPNQSQSTSIVNGNMSQSTTISLFIAAKKEGKFIIGPASINANGQKLDTKSIAIEVTKASAQQTAGVNGQQGSAEKSQPPVSGDELFVRTYLSKSSNCYIGEQITLTQKVYSRVDLRGFQNVKFPQYNGFWSKNEETNKQINLQQENINGVMYYVAEYHKIFLFPQRTGQLSIDPIELECVVRKPVKRAPRNVFEQFFGAGGYEDVVVKVKSKLVKVDVIDLPNENTPTNFTGAVGNFSYRAEISKDKVKANDAFNLKLTINGKGNINLVEPIKLNLPESFEVYDPKVSEKINTLGGVSGSKTFDYLIIPREKGGYVINKLDFSYFDSDKKQYVTLPSPDINLTVLEGDANSAQVISPSKKSIKGGENDIRYIKTGDLNLQNVDSEFFASWVHYLFLAIPTLLFFIGLFLVRKHIENNSDLVSVKERKAAKIAKQQLVIAEQHLKSNNKDLFFTEILNALHKYLGNKFALNTSDLSKNKISEMLLSKHVSAQTTSQVIETLNTCEYAKYAPSSVSADLQSVYNNTVELISQIEKQIKK